MRSHAHARTMSLVLVLLAAVSCTSPVTPGPARRVVVVGSDKPVAVAGTNAVLEVFVTDDYGTPVPDALVSFGIYNLRETIPIGDWVRTGADGVGRLEIPIPYSVYGRTVISVGQTVVTAKLETHGADSRCHFFLNVVAAPPAAFATA